VPPAWSELGVSRVAADRGPDEAAAAWLEKQLARPAALHQLFAENASVLSETGRSYDARENLDLRARSYLHANCAHCHVTAAVATP